MVPALRELTGRVEPVSGLRLAGPRDGEERRCLGIQPCNEVSHPATRRLEQVRQEPRTQACAEVDATGVQALNEHENIGKLSGGRSGGSRWPSRCAASVRSSPSRRCAATSRTRQRPGIVARSQSAGVKCRRMAISPARRGTKRGAVSGTGRRSSSVMRRSLCHCPGPPSSLRRYCPTVKKQNLLITSNFYSGGRSIRLVNYFTLTDRERAIAP